MPTTTMAGKEVRSVGKTMSLSVTRYGTECCERPIEAVKLLEDARAWLEGQGFEMTEERKVGVQITLDVEMV